MPDGQAPSPPVQTLPSLRVLLVEGTRVAQALLERALRACFVQTLELRVCRTPQEALAGSLDVELALVDLDLEADPALRLLGRLPRETWRIATTLYGDEDRLLPALRCGVHGYLLKQDSQERIVESLQRTVSGRPDLTPALARGLTEHLPPQAPDAAIQHRLLSILGRGASVREAAQELETTTHEVEVLVASIYRSIAQPLSYRGPAQP